MKIRSWSVKSCSAFWPLTCMIGLDVLLEKHSLLQVSRHSARLSNAMLVRVSHLALDLALENSFVVFLIENLFQKRRLVFLEVLNLFPQAHLFALSHLVNEQVFSELCHVQIIRVVE